MDTEHLSRDVFSADSFNLAGTWAFRLDSEDIGVEESWYRAELPDRLVLPGTTDEAKQGVAGAERRGALTRRHEYMGPAWYQRHVTIPEAWAGMDVELFLERVLWQSRVWVDGRECGEPLDSFAAPHVHPLGTLAPGRHVISIRIDNRQIHKLGFLTHAYGHETQSVWNGVVGGIELRARPATRIDDIRVFTRQTGDGWSLTVETAVGGSREQPYRVDVEARDPNGDVVLGHGPREVSAAITTVDVNLAPGRQPTPWSEFTPKLYRVVVRLVQEAELVDSREVPFGFREISNDSNRLLLNGVPVFMRGNLDCVHFPLTGYPSTRKEDWVEIFRTYKEHNLNHVRFHSWCPPKAAFEAADEMGLYVQAEAGIWINEGPDEGLGPGKGDPGVDPFSQAEMQRVVDTFGNHPSFVLMAIGNELGHSDFNVTGEWIRALKEHDPRRLYAASTARGITPHCDFNATHHVPGIGSVREHLVNHTDWDYEHQYGRTTVPILAHEIGQWPVYPAWSLCEKFTGTLRNTRLEHLREEARAAGVYDQQEDLTRASGSVNAMLYKDEVESFLRTPSCRGFQLLSMQDFQGQGEAYVGWLDMFWDSKGTTDPQDFRGYCSPVAVMARLPRYTFTENEAFSCSFVVRNDGPRVLESRELEVSLQDEEKRVLLQRKLRTPVIERGAVMEVGDVRWALHDLSIGPAAGRFTLVLRLKGEPEPNTYPVWIYPQTLPEPETEDVVQTDRLDTDVIRALQNGGTVFLDAHALGDPEWQRNLAAWRPLYWSLIFFPRNVQTLGLLVREEHPALTEFPTEHYNHWQWWDICEKAHGFDLSEVVSANYRPIAQPVPDFHANRKLGTVFEFKVGQGRILVCGYDLSEDRCRKSPAVRQLRYSLLKYVMGPAFDPAHEISAEKLSALFPVYEQAEVAAPPGFEDATVYLKPAAQLTRHNRLTPYKPQQDEVVVSNDVAYSLSDIAGTWKDKQCAAWIVGDHTARLTLRVPKSTHGVLYVRLNDYNQNERRGEIVVEGGRTRLRVGAHDQNPEGV
jgi:hypothetical protein